MGAIPHQTWGNDSLLQLRSLLSETVVRRCYPAVGTALFFILAGVVEGQVAESKNHSVLIDSQGFPGCVMTSIYSQPGFPLGSLTIRIRNGHDTLTCHFHIY